MTPEERLGAIESRLAVLDAVLKEQEKALTKQSTEYERRLNELNHAHERAQEVQHTYVTQDKYEDYIKQAKTAIDLAVLRLDEKVSTLENWRSKATGVGIILVLFAGAVGAAVVKAFGG